MSVSTHSDSKKKLKLFIRLTSETNDRLRNLLRYRGDLSRFIEEALMTTDLYKVALLKTTDSREAKGTTASTGKQVAERLKVAATYRSCSANSLANSAIAAWLSRRGVA